MAKIYAAPKGFEPPEYDYEKSKTDPNYHGIGGTYDKEIDAYIERLRAWCRKRAGGGKNDDLLGTILRYGVADGCAQYMVCDVSRSTIGVIHIETGDAWRAHALIEKGMNIPEARLHKKREDNPLFGNSRKEKAA